MIDPTAALPAANYVERHPNENEIANEGIDVPADELAANDHLENDGRIKDWEADRIFDREASGKAYTVNSLINGHSKRRTPPITLKVENFAGTKFRGSKKPRNFCVSRVLNFALHLPK